MTTMIAPSETPRATFGQIEEENRSQAGPLPVKSGEIGYVEGPEQMDRNSSPDITLPERHPADRDPESQPVEMDIPNPNVSAAAGSSSSTLASTTDSIAEQKKRPMFGFLKCKAKANKKPPAKIGGIELKTLLKFALQIFVCAGTIIAWVFATRMLERMRQRTSIGSSTIFVHVIFGLATLGELIFLERRIYRIRAERYSFIHPGEMLPSFRNRHHASEAIIALSPWNRPPLPTYAAALAQSGAGTGDVEDHVIAQQPPPAYGNTRGSTFLLSGYLDRSHIQRPVSVHSASSMPQRPRSYSSRDEEWETIQDVDRAMRLEETLSRLERPTSRV